MEDRGGEEESYVRNGFFRDAHSYTQQHTDITTDATYRRYTHTHTHNTAGGSSAMHTQRILHTHTLHE